MLSRQTEVTASLSLSHLGIGLVGGLTFWDWAWCYFTPQTSWEREGTLCDLSFDDDLVTERADGLTMMTGGFFVRGEQKAAAASPITL